MCVKTGFVTQKWNWEEETLTMSESHTSEFHLTTIILSWGVATASYFLKPIIHISKSSSSYFTGPVVQILSLHMLPNNFHGKVSRLAYSLKKCCFKCQRSSFILVQNNSEDSL